MAPVTSRPAEPGDNRAQPYRALRALGIPVYVRRGLRINRKIGQNDDGRTLRLGEVVLVPGRHHGKPTRPPTHRDEDSPPGEPGGLSVLRAAYAAVDQKTLRWAKMAISSRMAWVGAECHARSMARFWRLISRRLRMRSIMLMAVLTFPGLSGLVFQARLGAVPSVPRWKATAN